MLFSDATILTETSPLRAGWAKVGEQAEVPITGNRARRVVFGALNVGTGTVCLDRAGQWNQQSFQGHLRHIRSLWRGWNLVLFVDRGSPHTARRSRELAAALEIELRWLPTACPELNPVEGLWRLLKGRVLANEPTPNLDASLARAFEHLESMSPRDRLEAAGVLSGTFWLPTENWRAGPGCSMWHVEGGMPSDTIAR
ncbi:MAG: transposase [Actinomycetes bacterium]